MQITQFLIKLTIISDDYYKLLFYKIINYYDSNFKNNNFNLIAVDSTYNNTNINNINNIKGNLETSLNMGYYNINECIPNDITFCNLFYNNIVYNNFIAYMLLLTHIYCIKIENIKYLNYYINILLI